jgi:SAM-dependent methyltransferase
MQSLLYHDLVAWYHLLDPAADHEDEGDCFTAAFARVLAPGAWTLLELGAGAGNNARFMKRSFTCTLTDVSPEMLALSRAQNPECEHIVGDMRDLRIGRTFDAVLVHDAVTYMTSEAELEAAARTAFAHTRPGGAAIFAPDCYRETFRDEAVTLQEDAGARALRGVMWSWDPDPDDCTCTVDFALLLRDGDAVISAHDRHVEGVFSRETWRRILGGVGYEVDDLPRPIGDDQFDQVFLCRRPG